MVSTYHLIKWWWLGDGLWRLWHCFTHITSKGSSSSASPKSRRDGFTMLWDLAFWLLIKKNISFCTNIIVSLQINDKYISSISCMICNMTRYTQNIQVISRDLHTLFTNGAPPLHNDSHHLSIPGCWRLPKEVRLVQSDDSRATTREPWVLLKSSLETRKEPIFGYV